jgi:hypothetical protein
MTSFFKAIDRYALAILIAFELLACYNFYCREIAWYPPGNYDQAIYLAETYRTKERILNGGLGQLARAIGGRFNTGLAVPMLGAVSGLCVAGGRLPQLLVLFVGFGALQVGAFATARAVWRSRVYGYMLLGLVLCLMTPWYWAGGLFDFRFDFMAFCLYGIWACAVIKSELFLSRRWAIGCGLIGAFLVLNRFLTIVYLSGVSAGFALFCGAVLLVWRRDVDLKQRMRRRLANLALSVAVLAIIAAPFLIRSWREVFQYYGVGMYLGESKNAWLQQLGIGGLMDNLLFYPNSLVRDQWGITFVLGSAIVLIGSLIAGLTISRKAGREESARRDETFLLQVVFLLGAILGPVVVLTTDAVKSVVADSIVGVPAALLVVTLAARAAALRNLETPAIPRAVTVSSLAVFALGILTVCDQLSRHLPEYAQRHDLTRLAQLNKWMVGYASNHGWLHPGISVDVISPWFNGWSITDTGYEETGEFVDFDLLLGHDTMGANREEALSQLTRSDFLILTTPNSPGKIIDSVGTSLDASNQPKFEWLSILRLLNLFTKDTADVPSSGIALEGSTSSIERFPTVRHRLWPFYQRLDEYRSDLKAWADKNMILAQTVPFENFVATVYVSPTGITPDLSVEAH